MADRDPRTTNSRYLTVSDKFALFGYVPAEVRGQEAVVLVDGARARDSLRPRRRSAGRVQRRARSTQAFLKFTEDADTLVERDILPGK